MESPDAADREGRFIEAGGLSFHYEVHGSGEPLLLLHAGTLTGRMWQPYLGGFVERYLVIVPDLPNHGRSGSPSRPMTYRALADEVAALSQALRLRSPAIVGYSDGGQVALEIGMRYPNLPRSIAMGGVIFRDSDAYRAFTRSAVGDPGTPDVDPAWLARHHPHWAAWLDEIYGPGGWQRLLEQLKPMWTNPPTYGPDALALVAAPVLVFVGDRDELVPVEEAAALYRQLPDAELAIVPDASHGDFFANRTPTFQSSLLEFLQRHEA